MWVWGRGLFLIRFVQLNIKHFFNIEESDIIIYSVESSDIVSPISNKCVDPAQISFKTIKRFFILICTFLSVFSLRKAFELICAQSTTSKNVNKNKVYENEVE